MVPRTDEQNEQLRLERRAQLLEAAQRVFANKGFHAANVADVAAAAGVSQGTVYHYFDSKEDLLMAVYEAWETENLRQEIDAALHAVSSAAAKLHLVAQAAAQRITRSAALLGAQVEFWSHIPRHPAIRKGFKRMFAQMADDVAQIIQAGIDSGEFAQVDATVLARVLIAGFDGLVLQWLADKKSVDWQASIETLTTVVLRGLSEKDHNRR